MQIAGKETKFLARLHRGRASTIRLTTASEPEQHRYCQICLASAGYTDAEDDVPFLYGLNIFA